MSSIKQRLQVIELSLGEVAYKAAMQRIATVLGVRPGDLEQKLANDNGSRSTASAVDPQENVRRIQASMGFKPGELEKVTAEQAQSRAALPKPAPEESVRRVQASMGFKPGELEKVTAEQAQRQSALSVPDPQEQAQAIARAVMPPSVAATYLEHIFGVPEGTVSGRAHRAAT